MPLPCAECDAPSTTLCSACRLTRYCSPACQRRGWPRHKSTCALLGRVSPPLVTPAGVPLRAVISHHLDGFGRICVFLVYSDHLGVAALRPLFSQFFGYDGTDEEVLRFAYRSPAHPFPTEVYDVLSDPVHGPLPVGSTPSSFAARPSKKGRGVLLDLLLEHGWVKDTGVRVAMGYDTGRVYTVEGVQGWERMREVRGR